MFSVIGLIVVQLNIARCVYCIVVKHLVRLHCRINGYIYVAVTCGYLTDLVIGTFPIIWPISFYTKTFRN